MARPLFPEFPLRGLGALLDLVFPPGCPACGGPLMGPGPLCPLCWAGVAPAPEPACRVCGEPLATPGADACPDCRRQKPHFDRARSLAMYQGPLAQLVRGYKYQRRYNLGQALAGAAELLWQESGPPRADLVAPAPLHRLRLLWRGFNQAMALARPLARATGAVLAPRLLKRVRYTRPQVGLSAPERARNVERAFALGPDWRPEHRGLSVLLVDDVFTSGATLNACARVLKEAGAGRVEALTLLRTA